MRKTIQHTPVYQELKTLAFSLIRYSLPSTGVLLPHTHNHKLVENVRGLQKSWLAETHLLQTHTHARWGIAYIVTVAVKPLSATTHKFTLLSLCVWERVALSDCGDQTQYWMKVLVSQHDVSHLLLASWNGSVRLMCSIKWHWTHLVN